jgi:hypothetical protein
MQLGLGRKILFALTVLYGEYMWRAERGGAQRRLKRLCR